MSDNKEIIEIEIVEPTFSNELTIQNPNVKKIVLEKKENKIGMIITTNNALLKQTNYNNGVKTQQNILVPNFNTLQERNEAIILLCKDKHTQKDVAESMGLSQSRISQIIAENK